MSLCGTGYACGDMFKLNLITTSSANKINGFAYVLVHYVSFLRHNLLGHVNYKRLKETFRLKLIPNIDGNIEKCKTCMSTKITRSSFPNVQSDLDDLHSTLSFGGKK